MFGSRLAYRPVYTVSVSDQHPLTPPLNELIEHESEIRKNEAADIEAEEFGGMAG